MKTGAHIVTAGVVVILVLAGSSAASEEWATGRITLGGPWTYARSVAVTTDDDSIDGFFFPAPEPGRSIKATVDREAALCVPIPYNALCPPYDLNINFHGSASTGLGREWLGGCSTSEPDEVCTVPNGAVTGEVTAALGADLDVIVLLLD